MFIFSSFDIIKFSRSANKCTKSLLAAAWLCRLAIASLSSSSSLDVLGLDDVDENWFERASWLGGKIAPIEGNGFDEPFPEERIPWLGTGECSMKGGWPSPIWLRSKPFGKSVHGVDGWYCAEELCKKRRDIVLGSCRLGERSLGGCAVKLNFLIVSKFERST